MATTKILLIESGRANAPSFAPALEKKGFSVSIHHTLPEALKSANKTQPDMVILDAASMKTSGTRMCRQARAKLDGIPIILISPQDTRPDHGSGASLMMVQPFTARKLLNRVDRLLPVDEQFTIEAGPIHLDLVHFKVRCGKKKSRLTPRVAKLLELFLQNPGKLLTRKALIRKVWLTDYTGDTRTLDVHMSWLRKAIEQDPKKPFYIKTIRGMGYRLDIPEK
jgi:DNA-binding response OmpR family regulator